MRCTTTPPLTAAARSRPGRSQPSAAMFASSGGSACAGSSAGDQRKICLPADEASQRPSGDQAVAGRPRAAGRCCASRRPSAPSRSASAPSCPLETNAAPRGCQATVTVPSRCSPTSRAASVRAVAPAARSTRKTLPSPPATARRAPSGDQAMSATKSSSTTEPRGSSIAAGRFIAAPSWLHRPRHQAKQPWKPASSSCRSRSRPMNTSVLRRGAPAGHGRSIWPSNIMCTPWNT